jgi:hypothetical protein
VSSWRWARKVAPKKREQFGIEVRDRGMALDMFHHPYAYAAHSRVGTNTTREDATAEFSMARWPTTPPGRRTQ